MPDGYILGIGEQGPAGVTPVATQEEVNAGVNNSYAVTPLTFATWFANWPLRPQKIRTVIGNSISTSWDIYHSFGTRDVNAFVYRDATPWNSVNFTSERPDINTLRLLFSSPPGLNEYVVVTYV